MKTAAMMTITINRADAIRQGENEAFLKAIQTCDEEIYKAVTSILREAGLLPLLRDQHY